MSRPAQPRKPKAERSVTKAIRWPPELWAEIEALVPERERAPFIRRAMRAALMRRAAERLVGFYATDVETVEWSEFVGDDPDE
jgi:hypothetical protein